MQLYDLCVKYYVFSLVNLIPCKKGFFLFLPSSLLSAWSKEHAPNVLPHPPIFGSFNSKEASIVRAGVKGRSPEEEEKWHFP